MSGRKQRKRKEQIIRFENNKMSQEQLVEIQTEAYYRALKRIEDEKSNANEHESEKKKEKWYKRILFILYLFMRPWKIREKFNVSNRIHDNLLVLVVSGVLRFIGIFMWLFGWITIGYEIYHVLMKQMINDIISMVCIAFTAVLFGSIFILAGEEFEKETDSNKIYAYSASIIALISCIVGIITLMKM